MSVERRRMEVELLERAYEDVSHGPDYNWVIVHGMGLPEDGYNRASTDVLVTLEAGYPETPPDNFHVPAGLKLASGETPDRMQPKKTSHNDERWDRFSWHVDGGWTPASEVEDGSNLLTWFKSVEDRLSEAE